MVSITEICQTRESLSSGRKGLKGLLPDPPYVLKTAVSAKCTSAGQNSSEEKLSQVRKTEDSEMGGATQKEITKDLFMGKKGNWGGRKRDQDRKFEGRQVWRPPRSSRRKRSLPLTGRGIKTKRPKSLTFEKKGGEKIC